MRVTMQSVRSFLIYCKDYKGDGQLAGTHADVEIHSNESIKLIKKVGKWKNYLPDVGEAM